MLCKGVVSVLSPLSQFSRGGSHISLLILCKISKLRFIRAITNAAVIRSHIISPARFFCFGKESAIVFRALFTFRERLSKMYKNDLPEVNDHWL